MKKTIMLVLVLALSLGLLCGCTLFGGNKPRQSSRTPAETVLLFQDLCNARDERGLKDVVGGTGEVELDSPGYTFVSMKITVQNPSAQMEPDEIEFYKNEIEGLIDTAIVCVKQETTYKVIGTNEEENFVDYLDYYLVSTQSHPDWVIVYITYQEGY